MSDASFLPDPNRQLPCPWIEVYPRDFIMPGGPLPVLFPTWDSIAATFRTWDDLEAGVATWDTLMQGQPGYPGGMPTLTAGTGVTFGAVAYDGTEWWPTDVEGLAGSPPWESSTIRPATQDGDWLRNVAAGGRRITIEGTVLATSREAAARAARLAAAALAAPPRTGILRWRDADNSVWRIPVVLDEAVRIRHTGDYSFDVQMSVRGVDIKTPGAGVQLESESSPAPVILNWNTTQEITVGGFIPTWPTFHAVGPITAGSKVTLLDTGGGIPLEIALTAAVPSGQTLVIDCRRRRVILTQIGGSTPVRGMVSVTRWPMVPPGLIRLAATGSGDGHFTAHITDLA